MPTSVHGGLSTIDLVLKQCNERIKAQKKGVWYEEAAEAVKVSTYTPLIEAQIIQCVAHGLEN